jgi:hypothetical protein
MAESESNQTRIAHRQTDREGWPTINTVARANVLTLETGGCLDAGMPLFYSGGGGKYFMTCFRLLGLEGEVIATLT